MSNPIANLQRPKKQSLKPEPPTGAEMATVTNLHKPTSTAHVQLQFQVPPEIRRAVKAYAAENDVRMSELFIRMWDAYKRSNP